MDIRRLNEHLGQWEPEKILEWTWRTFEPQVRASSSFQTQSVPLLHMISRVCPEMPVLFIDTGFHFLETLAFRDELQARYDLNLVVVRPAIGKNQLLATYGEGLYRRDPDLCCYVNKVEPMERALAGMRAWVSGVRGDQTENRGEMEVVEVQPTGLLEIHPLLNWSRDQLWAYIENHRLPYHPLYPQGYRSIGCAPCTRPVSNGEDERAGRWSGTEKSECGLHTQEKRRSPSRWKEGYHERADE